MSRSNRRLHLVYAIVFVAFLDNFAMLPTIGPYAQTLGADPIGVGAAVAAYSVTNLVFNLVGGVLLDRAGRRRLVLAGLVLAILGVLAYPIVQSPMTLVAARLLHGAGGGLLVPALFTLIGDLAEPGARGRAMGRAGAVIGAAAVVGPAAAGAVRGAVGFAGVFVTAAAALAVALVVAGLALRDTAPRVPTRGGPTPTSRVLSRAQLWLAVGAVLAFTAAFGTLAAFLPDDVEALGAPPVLTGALFASLSIVAAALMLSPAARWVDRAGPAAPVTAGMALFAASLVLLAVGGTIVVAATASVVFGVGFGLLFPAASGAVAIAAPTGGRGRAFGLFNAAYSLGFIIGPPLAGTVTQIAEVSVYVIPLGMCVAVLVAAVSLRLRMGRGQLV